MYCLPVLKREEHRQALVKAATSGNPKFFLGTDSAPHAQEAKIAPCGEQRLGSGALFCTVGRTSAILRSIAIAGRSL